MKNQAFLLLSTSIALSLFSTAVVATNSETELLSALNSATTEREAEKILRDRVGDPAKGKVELQSLINSIDPHDLTSLNSIAFKVLLRHASLTKKVSLMENLSKRGKRLQGPHLSDAVGLVLGDLNAYGRLQFPVADRFYLGGMAAEFFTGLSGAALGMTSGRPGLAGAVLIGAGSLLMMTWKSYLAYWNDANTSENKAKVAAEKAAFVKAAESVATVGKKNPGLLTKTDIGSLRLLPIGRDCKRTLIALRKKLN